MTDSGPPPASGLQRGMALRAAQRTEEARAEIAAAARSSPQDPALALANARIHFETWRPSAALFERAVALAPGSLDAIAGLALALGAEGQIGRADALLSDILHHQPGWIAGHRQLAQLRIVSGAADGFDRSFAAAARSEPDDIALRLAWFQTSVGLRDWSAARKVITEGITRSGETRAFALARIFLASESDEASRDPHLFDPVAGVQDIGLDLARTRFHLRNQQPERAAAIATARIGDPAARAFWPYLSLAWRLLGDRRAEWLDRDSAFVMTVDLGFSDDEMRGLAAMLRGLLTMAAPYPEQSVRGGVQTDRHLFFHPDPVIQSVRQRATAAIRTYLDALPAPEPDHPLLGMPRGDIRYEGSWSVLLRAAGHHAAHTHARGWISSALHIELPDMARGGDMPDGRLAFGTPPAELGLPLAATSTVAPRAGNLVLFPSTTWHRTEPFAQGERLTIAFDVARAA